MVTLNKKRGIGLQFVAMGLALLVNACSSPPEKAEPRYFGYFFKFENKTGADFYSVDIYYGASKVSQVGILHTGDYATFGAETRPIPSEVEVRWKERKSGQRHSVKVKRRGIVPERFEGTVYFVFNADGTVDMKLVEDGDDKAYNEVMEGV